MEFPLPFPKRSSFESFFPPDNRAFLEAPFPYFSVGYFYFVMNRVAEERGRDCQ